MLPCVILSGGLATRLRPVTETIPKALISINGKPFIDHQLRLLRERGITDVVLCIGYLGEKIRDFAGDGSRYGLRLSYSFDGEKLLGTAGAIRRALHLLSDSFFVLYGDSYLECGYAAVAHAFQQSGKQALMTIYRNEGHYDSSNVQSENGMIVRYDKRVKVPQMLHIDYGLGVFRKSVFEGIPEGEVRDLAQVYQELLSQNELAAFEVPERFYEIGSLGGIQDLEQHLAAQPQQT
jgi:NDP-sugar pyrophosphorylase family protein